MISESMLREAALQSGEVYVQFFESTCDAEKPHVFSAQFDQKIEKLNRKANFSALRTFVRYTAAILLVMLISGSAWLMLDVKARAEFFGWINGFTIHHTLPTNMRLPSLRANRPCDTSCPQYPTVIPCFLKKKTTAWLQRYTKTARDGF